MPTQRQFMHLNTTGIISYSRNHNYCCAQRKNNPVLSLYAKWNHVKMLHGQGRFYNCDEDTANTERDNRIRQMPTPMGSRLGQITP